jgi:hypothetical protein
VNTPVQDESVKDERLEQRSRELFDTRVANLDARTRSRLNQVRQAALDAARGPAVGSPARWLLPVGSAAALGLVVLTATQFMRPGNEAPVIEEATALASTVDDLEILASSDDLEMLRNMEFYAWLETQPEGALNDVASGEAG